MVRTARDERLWEAAKEAAAKQKREGDYAYVMGVYQHMKGDSDDGKTSKGRPRLVVPSNVLSKMRAPGMAGGFGFATLPSAGGGSPPGVIPGTAGVEIPLYRERLMLEADARRAASMSPVLVCTRIEDVAKGLGLPEEQSTSLGRLVRGEADAAENEAVFRKNVMLALVEHGVSPTARRTMLYRALDWWGRMGGGAAARNAIERGWRNSMRRIDGDPAPALLMRAYAPNTMTSAVGPPKQPPGPRPRLLAPASALSSHGPPLQGLADPVRTSLRTRRALPPGAVRIHFSEDRRGYVRSVKEDDGTWRVLGRIHPDHVPDEVKKEAPDLPESSVHPGSPAKGKEPVTDAAGHAVSADGRLVAAHA